MGFIKLGRLNIRKRNSCASALVSLSDVQPPSFYKSRRLNIRKRNSCASALVSLSDVQPPSFYKSHILNGPINKLYISPATSALRWVTSLTRAIVLTVARKGEKSYFQHCFIALTDSIAITLVVWSPLRLPYLSKCLDRGILANSVGPYQIVPIKIFSVYRQLLV